MHRRHLEPWVQRQSATSELTIDRSLISRIAGGDEWALGLLYDRYYRLVYAIALRIAEDHQIAEEVTQDVFHAIWQSAKSFQPGSNGLSWLMGIARHRAIDATRSRRYRARRREMALLDDQRDTDQPTEQLLVREMVRDALVTLPTTQRQPLTLAFYAGMSHTEIADRLGTPVGTIKSRMRLGMMKLRDLLGRIYE